MTSTVHSTSINLYELGAWHRENAFAERSQSRKVFSARDGPLPPSHPVPDPRPGIASDSPRRPRPA
eukprot:1859954-Prymnesium_polylepis.1